MRVKEMIKTGELQLARAHCMDPGIDAELLYCHLTGADRVQVFLENDKPADEKLAERYFALIEQRAQRVPLQHITGTQEFMGFSFEVNSSVLIPRQDTECLVEEAAKMISGRNPRVKRRERWRVLDLCCGSGAIGVSLSKMCSNARITAADISGDALEVAERNAKKNRVKVKFLQGDLFETVRGKKFDMIVSNPPYVRTNTIPILQDEIKRFEPMLALDGGKDGLDVYRRIISQAPGHLKSHGVLVLEIGEDQAADVAGIIRETGAFTKVYVEADLSGNDRVVYASTLY